MSGSGSNNNKQQQEEDERLKGLVAAGAAAVAVVGFAAYCVGSLFSTKEEPKKTMKAPGKPGNSIYRDDFEGNPSEYFRGLRKK
ncbi:hypothetical protein QQ045_018925 [Rhodiola kirilowii]